MNAHPTTTEGMPVGPQAPRERRLRPVQWFVGLMTALVLVAAGFLGGTMFALNPESPTGLRLTVVVVAILAPISMLAWVLLRLRPKVKSYGNR